MITAYLKLYLVSNIFLQLCGPINQKMCSNVIEVNLINEVIKIQLLTMFYILYVM